MHHIGKVFAFELRSLKKQQAITITNRTQVSRKGMKEMSKPKRIIHSVNNFRDSPPLPCFPLLLTLAYVVTAFVFISSNKSFGGTKEGKHESRWSRSGVKGFESQQLEKHEQFPGERKRIIFT